MSWDPDRYLRFASHRTRPGIELLARIPDIDARRIVDLGCGTGDLTVLLTQRWPDAQVIGIDSSPDMVDRARSHHSSGTWSVEDISTWASDAPLDVIYSNAALHWIDDHRSLFRRLRSYVSDRGVFAAQMPDNWAEPTHRIPAEVLDSGGWPDAARSALLRDRLSTVDDYVRWLQPAAVDAWRTTYYHRLSGEDPVWTWVTGSILRPVLDRLTPAQRERFAGECRERYRVAYPPDHNSSVTLPFSRLFLVAHSTGRTKPSGPGYSST